MRFLLFLGETLGYHCPAPNCGRKFSGVKHLLRHGRNIHQNIGIPGTMEVTQKKKPDLFVGYHRVFKHYCPICNYGMDDPKEVEAHKARHESLAHVSQLHCVFCSEIPITSGRLKRHVLSFHVPHHAVAKCDECSQVFATTTSLNLHKKTHGQLKCRYCDFVSASLYKKKQHIDLCHRVMHTIFG